MYRVAVEPRYQQATAAPSTDHPTGALAPGSANETLIDFKELPDGSYESHFADGSITRTFPFPGFVNMEMLSDGRIETTWDTGIVTYSIPGLTLESVSLLPDGRVERRFSDGSVSLEIAEPGLVKIKIDGNGILHQQFADGKVLLTSSDHFAPSTLISSTKLDDGRVEHRFADGKTSYG